MTPLTTDWIIAITSIVTGAAGIIGVIIAIYQIHQIKTKLENTNLQLQNSVLTNVLRLEAEMNDKKEKVDNIKMDMMKSEIMKSQYEVSEDKMEIVRNVNKEYLNTAVENFLYSVNRLCFCIKNEYLKEKGWKAEYRDYISEVVETYKDKFDITTKYRNIIDIYNKWLRE